MRFLLLILMSPAMVWLLSPAAAQLTSGISAPEIREGAHSIGYRAAYDHAERALTGSVAVRGVIRARKTEARAVDLDYVQGELRWQITPDGARWASGLRLDARFRDGGRPGQVALHWLNQAQLTDTVRSRFSIIASIQTGSGRESGTFLQTRGELSQRLEDGVDKRDFNADKGRVSPRWIAKQNWPSQVRLSQDGNRSVKKMAGLAAKPRRGISCAQSSESSRCWLSR